MLTKSWWEHPINSWRTRYFSFFLTSEDAFLTKILSHWDLKVSRVHPGFGFFFFFEAVRESPTHAAPSSSRTRRFFKWGTPRTRPRPLRCISSSPPSRSQACPPLPCWAESLRWWWCPRPGPRPRAWSHRALSFPHRAPPLHRVEAFLLHATREDILTTRWRKGEKLLPWWIGTISCEKTSEWRPVGGTECPQPGPLLPVSVPAGSRSRTERDFDIEVWSRLWSWNLWHDSKSITLVRAINP